jgi:hypothetical protein
MFSVLQGFETCGTNSACKAGKPAVAYLAFMLSVWSIACFKPLLAAANAGQGTVKG